MWWWTFEKHLLNWTELIRISNNGNRTYVRTVPSYHRTIPNHGHSVACHAVVWQAGNCRSLGVAGLQWCRWVWVDACYLLLTVTLGRHGNRMFMGPGRSGITARWKGRARAPRTDSRKTYHSAAMLLHFTEVEVELRRTRTLALAAEAECTYDVRFPRDRQASRMREFQRSSCFLRLQFVWILFKSKNVACGNVIPTDRIFVFCLFVSTFVLTDEILLPSFVGCTPLSIILYNTNYVFFYIIFIKKIL